MKISKKWLTEKFASESFIKWFNDQFDGEKSSHEKVLEKISRHICSTKEDEQLVSAEDALWLLRNLKNIDADVRYEDINAKRTIFIAGNLHCSSIISKFSVYVTGNIYCDGDVSVKQIKCGGNIKVEGTVTAKLYVSATGKIKAKRVIVDGDIYCKKLKTKKKSKCKKLRKPVKF